ncbi:MAG: zinc-binding dehydrogenase [Saprospiraceae bacterium]|nr:zinc-binding dehydrogenase [Saprospiraceae bacterium]
MKALYIKEKGDYPVYEDFHTPEDNDLVKIKMLGSALNHRDLWIIKAQYAGLRYPIILGSDGVGIHNDRRMIINPSHNWGSDQSHQGAEYKILGLPDNGTMAEYCCLDNKYLYDAPDHLSDAEAAALPLAGLTAYRAMFVKGRGQKGQKVLITGIGGGVALFLLQFAIAEGLEVYVTSGNQDKIQKAIDLGAKAGYNYTDSDWASNFSREEGGVDLVVDGAAGEGFADLLKIVKPGGIIVNYGGTKGKINNLVPQTVFWKQISIIGSTMGSDKDFRDMLDFVTRNKIKPVIDSIHKISDYKNAFDKMDNGTQFGKIVLINN